MLQLGFTPCFKCWRKNSWSRGTIYYKKMAKIGKNMINRPSMFLLYHSFGLLLFEHNRLDTKHLTKPWPTMLLILARGHHCKPNACALIRKTFICALGLLCGLMVHVLTSNIFPSSARSDYSLSSLFPLQTLQSLCPDRHALITLHRWSILHLNGTKQKSESVGGVVATFH